ncbi:hypothetical protein IEQ34_002459 [Dendrobium chrysotoxum]|uniref:Secreted protein n=1 Tax=Dendrobium chrysotoxum TaxID=161865 RepID=A0AAV7HJX2_DENCH|nr:hypothetical protein IEQ34_002459 [Dendrobium chrysotoxum]
MLLSKRWRYLYLFIVRLFLQCYVCKNPFSLYHLMQQSPTRGPVCKETSASMPRPAVAGDGGGDDHRPNPRAPTLKQRNLSYL